MAVAGRLYSLKQIRCFVGDDTGLAESYPEHSQVREISETVAVVVVCVCVCLRVRISACGCVWVGSYFVFMGSP
jgi:hypothetical protein